MSEATEALSATTAIVAATNVNTESWLKEAITVLKESNISDRSEMQRLNKELKGYLESVRILENFNGQLIGDVEKARKSAMPTVVDKTALNKDLELVRKQLEEESLEATNVQIRIEKSEFDKEQAVAKMRFYQNEAESQKKAIQQLLSQLADNKNQRELLLRSATLAENDINKYKETVSKAEGELEKLSAQLKDSRFKNKKLEFEIQTLSDELAFNKAMFDEEINDLKSRTDGANVFTAHDLTAFYQNELKNSIFQIRRDFDTLNETQLKDLKARKEAEFQFAVKQAEIEKAQALEIKSRNDASFELDMKSSSELKTEFEAEQREFAQLKDRQKQLTSRLTQMERLIQDAKHRNYEEFNDKAAEVERLKRDNKEKIQELDMWYSYTRNKYEAEIQIYRSILNSQLKLNQDVSFITVTNPPKGRDPNPNPNTRPAQGGSGGNQGGGNGGSGNSVPGVIINGATGGNKDNGASSGGGGTGGSSAADTIISSGTNPSGASINVTNGGTGSSVVITSATTATEWTTQMTTTTTTAATTNAKPRDQSTNILRQVFDTFDANKNGSINSGEFDRILSALNVQLTSEAYEQILREADRDGNREINFDEFCRIMSPVLTGKFNDEELFYAFKKFDLDNSGEITVDELAQILSKVGQFYSNQQIADMIKTVDRDRNGRLNFEEFARLMKTSM